jgi:hypothetical protein
MNCMGSVASIWELYADVRKIFKQSPCEDDGSWASLWYGSEWFITVCTNTNNDPYPERHLPPYFLKIYFSIILKNMSVIHSNTTFGVSTSEWRFYQNVHMFRVVTIIPAS